MRFPSIFFADFRDMPPHGPFAQFRFRHFLDSQKGRKPNEQSQEWSRNEHRESQCADLNDPRLVPTVSELRHRANDEVLPEST